MASSLRSKVLFALLIGLASAALAQAPARVRGTITAIEGNAITVNGKEKILLGEKTEIVFAKPIALTEIQPGDFLGVTSMRRPDGTLTAYDVRRFPKPLNPGHRPFDGRDDQTMTNASVGAVVQSANGRELTMTYAGGSQKIVVPESASISTLVPGDRVQLVRGAPVSLTHDPNRLALRIQVGPPKQ